MTICTHPMRSSTSLISIGARRRQRATWKRWDGSQKAGTINKSSFTYHGHLARDSHPPENSRSAWARCPWYVALRQLHSRRDVSPIRRLTVELPTPFRIRNRYLPSLPAQALQNALDVFRHPVSAEFLKNYLPSSLPHRPRSFGIGKQRSDSFG